LIQSQIVIPHVADVSCDFLFKPTSSLIDIVSRAS